MIFKHDKQHKQNTLDTERTALDSDEELLVDTSYHLEDSKAPKKKRPSRKIISLLIVFILIILGLSRLTAGSGSAKSARLKVIKVTAGNVKDIYSSSGKIESENTKIYYSPVTAPISKFEAVVGSTVKTGDLLVSYDTTHLERDNSQAQLNLKSVLNTSQATKEKNAQAMRAENEAQAQAGRQVSQLEATVKDLERKVAAALAQHTANQAVADAQAPHQESLRRIIMEQQAIVTTNQQIIDQTNANYGGRRADLDTALAKPVADRTVHDNAAIQALKPIFDTYDKSMSTKAAAQTKIDEANRGLTNDPLDDAGYGQLKAQYEEANAQLQAATSRTSSASGDLSISSADLANLSVTDNLAELTALTPAELMQKGKEGIKADMDGVIASIGMDQTNTVSQGMALFSIASMDSVRVNIEVAPSDYGKLKVGSPATITIGQNTYEGSLTKINKIAVNNEKGIPVIGAQVKFKNPDENVAIGATAKISMTLNQVDNVLLVPTAVINASSKGDFVYVVEDNVVKKRFVELGTSSTTEIEVKSGLKKGEHVVRDLNVKITDGMRATALISDDAETTK